MSLTHETFDIIIIGAGPAGSVATLYAGLAGLKVLLLDKSDFPRDKVCGDAISGRSMHVLEELNLAEEAKKLPGAHIHSVLFSSPQNKSIDISLQGSKRNGLPTGLVIPRKTFDAFLFEKAKQAASQTITGFQVEDVLKENGQVTGVSGVELNSGNRSKFYSKIIIGADGFQSIVARKMGIYNREPEHWIVAVRQYYKNVSGLNSKIELHFVDGLLPGYFWIFPAGRNLANVGFGIVQSRLKKQPLELKKVIREIASKDAFAPRFKEAETVSDVRAWNLPVASVHRKNYGPGFMLIGDAAGLIDPFSGEGIGNAMISAKHAVKTARQAIEQDLYTEDVLSAYDTKLWKHIGHELRTSTLLQKMARSRFLLNLVINKAAANQDVQDIISGMMANTVSKRKLLNPFFYLKLLYS